MPIERKQRKLFTRAPPTLTRVEKRSSPFFPLPLPTFSGHSSFVVGGAVRDALLGIRPKDWDVLTTAGPTEISKIIKRATFPLPSSYSPPPPLLSPSSSPPRSNNGDASSFPSSSPPWSVKAWVRVVGARFPVAIVKLRGVVVEVSTLPGAEEEAAAAAEGGGIERSGENESESDVKTSSSSSSLSRSTLPPTLFSALSSNALRRDFTVNALYFDPGTGALHDPTGLGVADALSAKAVRVASALGPSHSFLEDPARGIRAIRLASRARLKLTPAVEAALVSVVVAGGDRSSSSSSSSSSSNLPPSPLLTQVPASRRAHELAALFAHGGSRRALALLWRYGLLDLLLPEHARWLEEARVPRKSGWRNRKRAAEVEGRGEEEGGGEEENDNGDDDGDDDGDGDGGGEGSGTEADSSAKEAATLIPPRLCSNEGETGETKTSPPPPPPPPRLRSLPGVESLAALDVAASASFPAPPALWAAALAMPLVASAALAEEENRRRRRIGGAGLGISDDEDESGGKESVGDESVGDESVGDESVGDESVGDESVGDESGLYLGRPLPSLSTSAPLPSLRRFRALVHAAVESMGGGGHHHVPRAVRAGAEALILRAAAAELDEAEKEKEERKRGGKRETKASLGGGACTRTRRQQSLQGGSRKEVWATVLSGAGKWVAISEGVEGGWGGERDRRGGGGGEKLNLETTTTTKKSVGVVGGEARAAARKKK